ncbi:MAG: glycosyltransferase, partial [Thermoleophilia bacterium]|nr:glycosyltransferase [Thermoleophilia bacterium]
MSVHNGEPYLQASVESILSQSWHTLELVIVDDGWTDDTWEILSSYCKRDPRMVIARHATNQGVAHGLNHGVALSSGEFVARQDADDVSHLDRLIRQLDYLRRFPDVGLVGCLPQFIDHDGRPLPIDPSRYPTEDAQIRRSLMDHNCLCVGVLLRRRHLEQVGGFQQDLAPAEDYDMWLRLAEVTRFASLSEALYYYRQHEGSASASQRPLQMWNEARALEMAVARRGLDTGPGEASRLVARDFLRAAFPALLGADLPRAHEGVKRACRWEPRVFVEGDLVERVVLRYLTPYQPQEPLLLVQRLFTDVLPVTRHMRRVERRISSRIHMDQVFGGGQDKARVDVLSHLRAGIQTGPRWLLNRGVLAIGVRQLLLRGIGLGARVRRRPSSKART